MVVVEAGQGQLLLQEGAEGVSDALEAWMVELPLAQIPK